MVNGPERQYDQRDAGECIKYLLGDVYNGPGLSDYGVVGGQYPAGGEFSGDFGDGVLRQQRDADGLRLYQRYGDVVQQYDGHDTDHAESDSNNKLYGDVYDADGLNDNGGGYGHGDASAGAESCGEFNERDGGHTGEHLSHWLCGHGDVVNGPERQYNQRDTISDDTDVFSDVSDGSWLSDHRLNHGQYGTGSVDRSHLGHDLL